MALTIHDTPAASIAAVYEQVAASFASRKTLPIAFRKEQLRQFWKLADVSEIQDSNTPFPKLTGGQENEEYLRECLYKDLRKPKVEAQGLEIGLFKNEVIHLLNNMDTYLAPETPHVPSAFEGLSPTIIRQAKGVVLVIGYDLSSSPLSLVSSLTRQNMELPLLPGRLSLPRGHRLRLHRHHETVRAGPLHGPGHG